MAKVGIIGTGWGARVQVPTFREAGVEVVAIAGHNRDRTRRIAGELGVEVVNDWRDVLATDADLISIVTPPSRHLEMATAALAAGKHVLSEKPTAVDSAEAEQLVAAANARPQQLALIDHELRFLPAYRAARERVAELGVVRYIDARYASPGRGDRTRAWDWWSDAGQGGGVWGAVGSHFVDTIRYIGCEIEAARGFFETIVAERPHDGGMKRVTSDDFASVQLRLRGSGLATINLSVVATGADETSTLTIHCEHGALRLIGEELLFATRGEPAFRRIAGDDFAQRPGNTAGGAFGSGTLLLAHALRAAIDDGDRAALAPAATFVDGLAQQRVLDAARRSANNQGRWETV